MEIEKAIGDYLRERGLTLAVAESCTGGLVSDRITNVSGSSDYFEGGIVSYSNEAKARHLGIPLKYIKRHGAVSPGVAKRMARGVRKAFDTTFGLSTTGVAGPSGGTKRTPVGTVFIAFSDGERTLIRKENFEGSRKEIKEKAARSCLEFLYKNLLSLEGSCSIALRGRQAGWLTDASGPPVVLIRKARLGISGPNGRVGVFPASFNPPTKAHVALVREAKKHADLDEILVLLDVRAMDKTQTGAGFEDRLILLRELFKRDPEISIGIANRGLFVDKLRSLKEIYGSTVEFDFIVGFDTLLRVMDEKYYRSRKKSLDSLFSQSRFLVASRGLYDREAFEELFRRKENARYGKQILFFTLPKRYLSVSSSLVREKIAGGQPIKDLVPLSVLRLIEKDGLYAERRR